MVRQERNFFSSLLLAHTLWFRVASVESEISRNMAKLLSTLDFATVIFERDKVLVSNRYTSVLLGSVTIVELKLLHYTRLLEE